MRILIAHDVSSAHPAGMNRMMRFTHEGLARAGHELEYFCAEDVRSISGYNLGRRFVFPWRVYQHAVAAYRRGQPYDIINVHEPCSAVISKYKQNAGNPKVVVTTHGSEHRSWELALEEARLGRSG